MEEEWERELAELEVIVFVNFSFFFSSKFIKFHCFSFVFHNFSHKFEAEEEAEAAGEKELILGDVEENFKFSILENLQKKNRKSFKNQSKSNEKYKKRTTCFFVQNVDFV